MERESGIDLSHKSGRVRDLLTRLSNWILVVALTLSLGVHWALLQSVAWASMLVSYSRDASFLEAVNKTFDGEHPCTLCKEIEKGRSHEKQQEDEKVKPGCKVDLGVISNPLLIHFAERDKQVTSFHVIVESRGQAPPTPPPRFLLHAIS